MKPVLTIAICTYNRESYIIDCLNSFQEQTASVDQFEILVVNNNSTDRTSELVQHYQSKPNLRIVNETEQGLSYARNAAMNACHTQWLFYFDDDAIASPDLVQIALDLIRREEFEIFGGTYLPWYKHGRPYWMKDRYVQSPLVGKKEGYLKQGEYLSGGIFAIKRNLLKEFGGFNTALGMKGGNPAYGEETELQKRLRARGHKIYFKPELVMDHLVAKYKLDLQWFFKSAFGLGRDIVEMKHWEFSNFLVLRIALEAIAMTLVKLPINALRLFGKHYYVENLLIDTFKKVVKRAGMIARLMEIKKR